MSRLKKVDGTRIEKYDDLCREGVNFFTTLFTDELQYTDDYHTELNKMLEPIPRIVSCEDNQMLEAFPTQEEVWATVFGLDPESSAGPDGFSGRFFQECWDIVGNDTYQAVLDFFCGSIIPKAISATLIALIQKKKTPSLFSDYRPISMCNFCYKIISELLVNKLEGILPKIISPQQSDFVKDRLISDNILLAQELVGHLSSKIRGKM